jgi:hypothetical protein
LPSFITTLTLSVVVAASSVATVQEKPRVNDDARVLADFRARVDQYVELRKKADDTAPSLKKTEEPGDIRTAQQMLVERIGIARSGAKPGDIFTPEIAAQFKRIIRPESREQGTKAAIKADKPAHVPFKVNGPYPDKQPLATMPPNVLAALPALPKDIDYRFVDKHLILRDTRANLIIDYMLNVIQ